MLTSVDATTFMSRLVTFTVLAPEDTEAEEFMAMNQVIRLKRYVMAQSTTSVESQESRVEIQYQLSRDKNDETFS
jgi:hypothetical protein